MAFYEKPFLNYILTLCSNSADDTLSERMEKGGRGGGEGGYGVGRGKGMLSFERIIL